MRTSPPYGAMAGAASPKLLDLRGLTGRLTGRDSRPHRRRLDAVRRDDRPMPRAVPGWCLSHDRVEGAAECSQTGEADTEADVGHAPIGLAEQEHRALDPPPLEVPVRPLAEHCVEAADEVRGRDVHDGGHGPYVKRLGVGAIHRVAGPEQAPVEVLGFAAHAVTLRDAARRIREGTANGRAMTCVWTLEGRCNRSAPAIGGLDDARPNLDARGHARTVCRRCADGHSDAGVGRGHRR